MKFKFSYIMIALLLAINLYSQSQDSIRIRGVFRFDVSSSSLVLKSFSENFQPLLETVIDDNSFSLSLPSSIAPGIYRLQYNLDCGQQFVDIIINGRDKDISFILNGDGEFPVFVGSEENKAWSSYERQNRRQVSKLEFLYNFLSFYPASQDEVVQRVTEAVSLERNKYYTNFDKFVKKNKGSWAEKMVSNQPYYFSDPTVVPTRRDFVRHCYYWDGINTNDPELLNSPLYSTLIDNYIDFHGTGDYTESELEGYFNRRVAVIMEKFSHNVSMKFFATDYLKEKRSEMIKN